MLSTRRRPITLAAVSMLLLVATTTASVLAPAAAAPGKSANAAAVGSSSVVPPSDPKAPLRVDALPDPGTGAITTTIPAPGSRVQVSAGNYAAGEPVAISIAGVTLTTATADAYGDVAASLTIPATLRGNQTITLAGQTRNNINSIAVTVANLPSVSHAASTSVWWWLLWGALGVAVVAGIAGLIWRRRGQPSSQRHRLAFLPGLWSRWREARTRSPRLRWTNRVVLGVLGLGLLWIVVTAALAGYELIKVKDELHQIRAAVNSGNLAAARNTADEVRSRTSRAHFLTSGPAWATAAAIPLIGDPFESVRGLTADTDLLGSHVLPQLVELSDRIDPSKLRLGSGHIDIATLESAAPALATSASLTSRATASINSLPHDTWLPFIDSARRSVARELTGFNSTISAANRAARVVPTMLGRDTPQRYFVAFLNPAQARGLGGIPGAFGILLADKGKISFTHFGNDSELFVTPTGLDLGGDYDKMYKNQQPTTYYINSTVSPDFPYAAQIWAAMWQKRSGQHIDGAVSIDPTALSYLLSATGPTKLKDGTQVSANNIVQLVESDEYAKFPDYGADQTKRKKYLLDIADAVDNRILGSSNVTGLVRAAAEAAGQRRLLVWTANGAAERTLGESPLGGVLSPSATEPSIAINSAAGGKLDYYLDETRPITRSLAGAERSTTEVTLTNKAPTSGLSRYVTDRLDQHSYTIRTGDNRVYLTYCGPSGSHLVGASVNSVSVLATPAMTNSCYSVDIEIPTGTAKRIELTTVVIPTM